MRTLLLAALTAGLLLAGQSVAAPIPKEDKAKKKTTEEKVMGKWKLVKTDAQLPEGFEFVIEYGAKGKLTFTRTATDDKDAKPFVSEGKYEVKGDDKIDWTISEGGNERGEVSTIKTLTDDKLVIEDPDGIKEEFERVVEKKKDEKKKKDD